MSTNPAGSFVRSLRLSPKTDPDLTTFVVDIEERGVHVPELMRLLLRAHMEKTDPRYLEPAFWKQMRHHQVVRYHRRMLQRVEGELDTVEPEAQAPKVKQVAQVPAAQPPARPGPKVEPVTAQAQTVEAPQAPSPVVKTLTPAQLPEDSPPLETRSPNAATPPNFTTGYGGKFLDES